MGRELSGAVTGWGPGVWPRSGGACPNFGHRVLSFFLNMLRISVNYLLTMIRSGVCPGGALGPQFCTGRGGDFCSLDLSIWIWFRSCGMLHAVWRGGPCGFVFGAARPFLEHQIVARPWPDPRAQARRAKDFGACAALWEPLFRLGPRGDAHAPPQDRGRRGALHHSSRGSGVAGVPPRSDAALWCAGLMAGKMRKTPNRGPLGPESSALARRAASDLPQGRTPLHRIETRDVGVSCTINQEEQSLLASPRGRTRPSGALV